MFLTRKYFFGKALRFIALIALMGNGICLAEILDQAKVHYEYSNGEFDQVEKDLEAFKARNKSYSRDDSIFIAKHLAVVYAANPKTREKGRYYMFRLLELMPGAKIVDMFVSEEIDRIFDKVREEFNAKAIALGKTPYRPTQTGPPPTGNDQDPRTPSGTQTGKPVGASNAGFWLAGGVGLLAVGTAAYFLIPRGEAPADKIYPVERKP